MTKVSRIQFVTVRPAVKPTWFADHPNVTLAGIGVCGGFLMAIIIMLSL